MVNDETVIRFFKNPRGCSISLPLLVLPSKARVGGRVGNPMEALLEAFGRWEVAYSYGFLGQRWICVQHARTLLVVRSQNAIHDRTYQP